MAHDHCTLHSFQLKQKKNKKYLKMKLEKLFCCFNSFVRQKYACGDCSLCQHAFWVGRLFLNAKYAV